MNDEGMYLLYKKKNKCKKSGIRPPNLKRIAPTRRIRRDKKRRMRREE
jgi:hypothetical protein